MPMLLEDLAEETAAGNRRAADRQRVEGALVRVRQTILESARQATDYAVARLPESEVAWNLALGLTSGTTYNVGASLLAVNNGVYDTKQTQTRIQVKVK